MAHNKNYGETYKGQAESVGCPTCEVVAGAPCVNDKGVLLRLPHTPRYSLYKRTKKLSAQVEREVRKAQTVEVKLGE